MMMNIPAHFRKLISLVRFLPFRIERVMMTVRVGIKHIGLSRIRRIRKEEEGKGPAEVNLFRHRFSCFSGVKTAAPLARDAQNIKPSTETRDSMLLMERH